MKEIILSKGQIALVDDDDFETLSEIRWYMERNGYVRGSTKEGIVSMHRLLMGMRKGDKLDVDHINGLRHDNRRSNLRICTRSQNLANQGLKKANTSGFKGASWCKEKKLWQAKICFQGKQIHLGMFPSAEEAHKAYCEAAKKLRGEYANPGSRMAYR